MRVKLARRSPLRWLSHTKYVNLVHDAVDKAGLPVARSGKGGRLSLVAGPPLPPGCTSLCEYVDAALAEPPEGGAPITATDFGKKLAERLPRGLDLLWRRRLPPRALHLRASVTGFWYTIRGEFDKSALARFETSTAWPLRQMRKGRERCLDLRQAVLFRRTGCRELTMGIDVLPEGIPKLGEVLSSVLGMGPGEVLTLEIQRVALRFRPLPYLRALVEEQA